MRKFDLLRNLELFFTSPGQHKRNQLPYNSMVASNIKVYLLKKLHVMGFSVSLLIVCDAIALQVQLGYVISFFYDTQHWALHWTVRSLLQSQNKTVESPKSGVGISLRSLVLNRDKTC